ncbi:MAG: hypothetical protein AB1728_03370 [Bacteroidota bacterium]
MYEKLLSEAEKILEEQKEKELPILAMWDAMMERSEQLKFEMPENIGDFECLLEADKRFVFSDNKLAEELDEVDVGEEEAEYEVGEEFFAVEEIEKLGFNQHQIVGLKKYEKRKLSDDDDDEMVMKPNISAQKSNHTKAAAKKTAAKPRKNTKPTKKKK